MAKKQKKKNRKKYISLQNKTLKAEQNQPQQKSQILQ